MAFATCFTCGKEFKPSNFPKDRNTPRACSKECKTKEFNDAVSSFRLETRGFPSGYKTLEQYQKALYDNELVQKTCIECGTAFEGIRKKEDFCSEDCIEKNRIKRIRDTKECRYGSPGFNNREKAKTTCLEKYGSENPQQVEEIKEKTKKTCIEKYGVDNPSKSLEIIEKIAQVHMERYGVRNVFQRRDIMESSYEKAFGEGITNPQQVPEIAEKTFLARKIKYDLQGAVPKDALMETNLEKYGTEQFFSSERGKITRDNLKETFGYSDAKVDELFLRRAFPSRERWIEQHGDSKDSIEQYRRRCSLCDSSSFNWALKVANGDIEKAEQIFTDRQIKIKTRFGVGSKLSLKTFSGVEKHLIETHQINPDDIYVGDENRKEFFLFDQEHRRLYFYDFTIRSKKIIIEFNGCFFHARNREDDPEKFDKDERKRLVAEDNGFKFFVVWDDKSIKENQQFLIEELDKCLMT